MDAAGTDGLDLCNGSGPRIVYVTRSDDLGRNRLAYIQMDISRPRRVDLRHIRLQIAGLELTGTADGHGRFAGTAVEVYFARSADRGLKPARCDTGGDGSRSAQGHVGLITFEGAIQFEGARTGAGQRVEGLGGDIDIYPAIV